MTQLTNISRVVCTLLVTGVVAGCEQVPTEPAAPQQSQLVLRSADLSPVFSTASFDPATTEASAKQKPSGGNGPVDLATISTVEVQISRIALLTSGSVAAGDSTSTSDDEDDSEAKWVDLELDFEADSTWFNLKTLAADSTLGTVPASVTGEIKAVKIFFGDARVVFKDGTKEALSIPRGHVTIPTRGVVVNTGSDVAIVFERLASFGRIVRTGNGLIMTPSFAAENGGRSTPRGAENGKGKAKGKEKNKK